MKCIEIPEIINGIIFRLCVENSMKIAQKATPTDDCESKKRENTQKNHIELDPDDREMMMLMMRRNTRVASHPLLVLQM